MNVYIDITQLNLSRANTGIQRVVKEFISRASIVDDKVQYAFVFYDLVDGKMKQINNIEIEPFLQNNSSYRFKDLDVIDFNILVPQKTSIFFDIDSVWNTPFQRSSLYPLLKKNGFIIVNFIYDLVPILFPEYTFFMTSKRFRPFLNSVLKYSDMVLFDSMSAQDDFLNYKKASNIKRDISTKVVYLGSDFIQKRSPVKSTLIEQILVKKFILFVGTLEPRKSQEDVLDAFEELVQKYPDLNLVFIGKKGWNVDGLAKRIQNHKLINQKLFWLEDIDDDTLLLFYKKAFIVTYVSKYEGYGLPIIESLSCGNITIASNNSSMYEAGGDFADYLEYNTKNEIIELIDIYCENESLYTAKKQFIQNNFETPSWDTFFSIIHSVFIYFPKALGVKKNHLKKFQFVFISIDIPKLSGTIKAIDKYIDFVKEYIIITSPECLDNAKKISTHYKIIAINEEDVLKEHVDEFKLKDHQSKNWLLRASLLQIKELDDEFIMLDDDNRPLKKISINYFINDNGAYNAYYFYNLLYWNSSSTSYDFGQIETKKSLLKKDMELFSYSVHAPQIINKSFWLEASREFFSIGLQVPLDEWSIYFNYSITKYPYCFVKKKFETLNWPDSPTHWKHIYRPEDYSFENYYPYLLNDTASEIGDYRNKISQKNRELAPFYKTEDIYIENRKVIYLQNLTHGVCRFCQASLDFYLLSIPYFLIIHKGASLKIPIRYKLLFKKSEVNNIEIRFFLDDKMRASHLVKYIKNKIYQDGVEEIDFSAKGLTDGIYNLSFNLYVNNEPLYPIKSPYEIKLIVRSSNLFRVKEYVKYKEQKDLKTFIKEIPVIGFMSRWLYNLIRINNLKHRLTLQEDKLENLYNLLQRQSNSSFHESDISFGDTELKVYIQKQIARQIFYQSASLQNRIDQFLFDEKMKDRSDTSNLSQKPPNFSQDFFDQYYLSFENTFRGSRETILQRSKEYLQYFNSSEVTKALDLGCDRGEWLEVLATIGIDAVGVDSNAKMIQEAHYNGIKSAIKEDIFDFLKNTKNESYDLITSFHVIEHLEFNDLMLFFMELKRVLKPKGTILLETLNPENILVSTLAIYKDPACKKPLPAEIAKFMLHYVGFPNVTIKPLHPFPEKMKTQDTSQVAAILNSYLCKEQDYLVIINNDTIKD